MTPAPIATFAALARVKKWLVTLVALIAQLAALGVLHGTALSWAIAITAAAESAGVYVARNAKPLPTGSAGTVGVANPPM